RVVVARQVPLTSMAVSCPPGRMVPGLASFTRLLHLLGQLAPETRSFQKHSKTKRDSRESGASISNDGEVEDVIALLAIPDAAVFRRPESGPMTYLTRL